MEENKYYRRKIGIASIYFRVKPGKIRGVLTGLSISFNVKETDLKYIDCDHWLDSKACKHALDEITAEEFEAALKKAKGLLK